MPRTSLALRVLLASITVACLFAMVAVLGGDMDRGAGKMFGSALVVGAASLLAMASLSGWHHAYAKNLARACLVSTVVATFGLLYLIWGDPRGDTASQIVASACAIAAACAHATILSQARLAPMYQWVRPAVIACNALLVSALMSALWSDSHRHLDGLFDVTAILAIADVGLTLATLVLHSMSRHVVPPAGAADGERAVVCYCPGCGKRLWQPAGEIVCWHCQQAFEVHPRAAGELAAAVARVRAS